MALLSDGGGGSAKKPAKQMTDAQKQAALFVLRNVGGIFNKPLKTSLDLMSVLKTGSAGGDGSLDDYLGLGLDKDGSGSDGGFAPPAWSSTREAAELSQKYQLEILAKQQAFDAAQEEARRKAEREKLLEQLKAEREKIFADMLGTDPVRAALFAMGIGGDIMPGGDRFAALTPMKGATKQVADTKTALQNILGRGIDLGASGVTGLQDVRQAATAFSGGIGAKGNVGDVGAARKLIGSAYGVGAVRGKGRPGMDRDEILRQIATVTPEGAF
jgi:hypothetical protein